MEVISSDLEIMILNVRHLFMIVLKKSWSSVGPELNYEWRPQRHVTFCVKRLSQSKTNFGSRALRCSVPLPRTLLGSCLQFYSLSQAFIAAIYCDRWILFSNCENWLWSPTHHGRLIRDCNFVYNWITPLWTDIHRQGYLSLRTDFRSSCQSLPP